MQLNNFIVKVKLIGLKNYFCHIIALRVWCLIAIIAKVNRSMKMIGKIEKKKMINLEKVHRIHTLYNCFAVIL
jgi:uncharacterized membrane protein YjjP (DUF1212 family)